MRRLKINEILIYFSVIILLSIIFLKPYIVNFFSSSFLIVLLIIANFALILGLVHEKIIKISSPTYIVCLILTFLPSLYNNYYLKDGFYSFFFLYLLVIVFCILLSLNKPSSKLVSFIFAMSILFSLLTSLVTWLSIFNPNLYVEKFIPLLPSSDRLTVLHDFLVNGMRMGLTNHYSRNAFYIILGILFSIYFYLKNKKPIHIVNILFLFVTLLSIGKRGYFIFFTMALVLSYLISNKINLKTISRLILGICVFSIIFIAIYEIFPSTHLMIDRIFFNHGDISTGRFEVYQDVWNMYKENSYIPLGWGKYTSSTNYAFVGVHNDYLQLLCETGIIGLFLMLVSNFTFLKISISKSKKKNLVAIIGLIYNLFFLLYSLTGIPHYDFEVYSIFYLLNLFVFMNINGGSQNEECPD